LVVVAGEVTRPEVVLRSRADLGDPAGRVRKNAYHAARTLQPRAAVELIEAAERIATEQAELAIASAVRGAAQCGAVVRSCAVVVGASGEAPLESILRSHALVHAAEGRLYQRALLRAAASCGLDAVAVPKQSIREQGEIDQLRRELGPPWAEDQKLAALAAWLALA
jgi:hypothetical protein